jgi:hypothetical protein
MKVLAHDDFKLAQQVLRDFAEVRRKESVRIMKLVAVWHGCTDECSRPCRTKAIFAALVRQLRSETR